MRRISYGRRSTRGLMKATENMFNQPPRRPVESPIPTAFGISYMWDTGSDHQHNGVKYYANADTARDAFKHYSSGAYHHLYNLVPIGFNP